MIEITFSSCFNRQSLTRVSRKERKTATRMEEHRNRLTIFVGMIVVVPTGVMVEFCRCIRCFPGIVMLEIVAATVAIFGDRTFVFSSTILIPDFDLECQIEAHSRSPSLLSISLPSSPTGSDVLPMLFVPLRRCSDSSQRHLPTSSVESAWRQCDYVLVSERN